MIRLIEINRRTEEPLYYQIESDDTILRLQEQVACYRGKVFDAKHMILDLENTYVVEEVELDFLQKTSKPYEVVATFKENDRIDLRKRTMGRYLNGHLRWEA